MLLAALLLLVQVAAAILAGVPCALRIRDFAKAFAFSLRAVPPMVRASAPIALLGLLGVIYQRFSLLALPALAGSTATGQFSAAARLVEATKLGHLAVLTALYPMMAQARDAAGAVWSRRFRIPALLLLIGAVFIAAALNLLAGPVVAILFGRQYLPAIPLVRILAWVLVPYSINSFLTLALLARGEERVIVQALLASTGILAGLNLWWAPGMGASGAAWAALCAEVVQSAALVVLDMRSPQLVRSLFGVTETTPGD